MEQQYSMTVYNVGTIMFQSTEIQMSANVSNNKFVLTSEHKMKMDQKNIQTIKIISSIEMNK